MLSITVQFLHRTFRASSADDASLTGVAEAGEWPPSPARLVSALVAADGTRDRSRVTRATASAELVALESAMPLIYADIEVETNALLGRYVVIDKSVDNTTQNYPGRTATLVRPGVRIAMRDPVVTYVWPDLELDDDLLRSLRLRAARIGYLGCADSPVRVRINAAVALDEGLVHSPDSDGELVLPVPFDGYVDMLDHAFSRWQEGNALRRAWLPSRHARYRTPAQAQRAVEPPTPPMIWLRFGKALRARDVVAVADTLRKATLDKYANRYGNDIPSALLGHHAPGTRGVEHVRFLPLPFAGSQHADGRIRGACVWFPLDTDPVLVSQVRAALDDVDELVAPKQFSTSVAMYGGEELPLTTNPLRWRGPSRTWVTVFPFVYERHVRKEPSLDDVGDWCEFAQLPRPVACVLSTVPLVHGAANLGPHDTTRNGQSARAYRHARLTFADDVVGPIAFGRGRHFGLGLMMPERSGARDV